MEIRPGGAKLFHEEGQADTQTDMTKLTVAVRSAPQKEVCFILFVFISFLYFIYAVSWVNRKAGSPTIHIATANCRNCC
jgi:hypothetical protein